MNLLEYPISEEEGNLSSVKTALRYLEYPSPDPIPEESRESLIDKFIQKFNRRYFLARCGISASYAVIGTSLIGAIGGAYLEAMGGPNDLMDISIPAGFVAGASLLICKSLNSKRDKKLEALTELGVKLEENGRIISPVGTVRPFNLALDILVSEVPPRL